MVKLDLERAYTKLLGISGVCSGKSTVWAEVDLELCILNSLFIHLDQ